MIKNTQYYYWMNLIEQKQEKRNQMIMRNDISEEIKNILSESVSDVNELIQRILKLEDEIENLQTKTHWND